MASKTSPISVRLGENCLKNLDALMISDYSGNINRSEEMRQLIQMTANNYRVAYNQMLGMFTEIEMAYICQAFNATIIDYGFLDSHSLLVDRVEDFERYGSMGFFSDSDFDPKKLIDKLSKLDTMQSFIVINSAAAFWREAVKNPSLRFDTLGIVKRNDDE